jgi:hypothetical protein
MSTAIQRRLPAQRLARLHWMNLSSADQLWKGAAGLAAVAGSLRLVAAKPVFSTAVERLGRDPPGTSCWRARLQVLSRRSFKRPLFGVGVLVSPFLDPCYCWQIIQTQVLTCFCFTASCLMQEPLQGVFECCAFQSGRTVTTSLQLQDIISPLPRLCKYPFKPNLWKNCVEGSDLRPLGASSLFKNSS